MYDPATDRAVDGVAGLGPVVLGVDNFLAELLFESSCYFSQSLAPFVVPIASADFGVTFEDLELPAPIKKAVILHRGELTPEYEYMGKFLKPTKDS